MQMWKIPSDPIYSREGRSHASLVCWHFLLIVLVVGCKPAKKYSGPISEFPHVITGETEFYTSGPQQGQLADGVFRAGTKVRDIEEAGSYVLVRTEGDVEAFDWSDAVIERVPGDLSAVVAGNNQFALELNHQLRRHEGNLFFSPSSLSLALAMTYAGAPAPSCS